MLTCYPLIHAILLVFFMTPPSFAEGSEAAAEPLLIYTAPFQQIQLSADFRLVMVEDLAEYDNPVSSIPSRRTRVEHVHQLTREEGTALLRFIQESGFYDLEDSYGAGEGKRSYPFSIFVRDGALEKEVRYHSRPDTEARPEAFVRVEKEILALVQQARETHLRGNP